MRAALLVLVAACHARAAAPVVAEAEQTAVAPDRPFVIARADALVGPVADDEALYWADDEAVYRRPLGGPGAGAVQRLAQVDALQLAVGGDLVYVATVDAVATVPIAGGEATKLADGFDHIVDLAADDGAAYVATAGEIVRVARDGGRQILVEGQTLVIDLAVSDGWIYWLDRGPERTKEEEYARHGSLRRVSTGGGTAQILTSDLTEPARLAIHDGRVWWSDLDAIRSITISGEGLRLELTLRMADSFAVDAGGLAFETASTVYERAAGGVRLRWAPSEVGVDADFSIVLGKEWIYVVGRSWPSSDHAIVALPRGDGAPEATILAGEIGQALHLAMHGGEPLWIEQDFEGGNQEAVFAGGFGAPIRKVAGLDDATADLGVVGDEAIVADESGQISAIPLGGEPARVVASAGMPLDGFAVHGDEVRWLIDGALWAWRPGDDPVRLTDQVPRAADDHAYRLAFDDAHTYSLGFRGDEVRFVIVGPDGRIQPLVDLGAPGVTLPLANVGGAIAVADATTIRLYRGDGSLQELYRAPADLPIDQVVGDDRRVYAVVGPRDDEGDTVSVLRFDLPDARPVEVLRTTGMWAGLPIMLDDRFVYVAMHAGAIVRLPHTAPAFVSVPE